MVIDTFSPIGKVSLLIQVLPIGRQDGIFVSKQIVGFIWKPRTGSFSHPVTNFKMLWRDILPSTLLPAEKRKKQKLVVHS